MLRSNAFGSVFGDLPLTKEMPLGEYRITFKKDKRHIGNAVLFRLEEYKLPEYRVTIKTPEKDGQRKNIPTG